MTRVSIGVPVHNGMPYLPEAIESLLAQDHADLEIVICDNGSTDGTEGYCRQVASLDPRVTYHRFDTNSGAAANFQRCLELSTGEYFAWAAHDDRLDSAFVRRCLATLEQHPEAAMCTPAHRVIDEAGRPLDIHREPAGLADADLSIRLRAHLRRRSWLTLYGLARRSALLPIGPPEPIWGWDVVYVWRLLLLAPIVVLDEPLADYRVFYSRMEETVLRGVTAVPSQVAWPYTGMRHSLRRAADDPLNGAVARVAAHRTLHRWTRSRAYRELLFCDLFVELRSHCGRRAHLRAAILAPVMLLLSPRMVLRGLRLQWRIHHRAMNG